MHQFRDIVFSRTFIEDYDAAPSQIREKLDKKLHIWAIRGAFTPSAQPHRANLYDEDLWILYLRLGAGGHRILARFDGDCLVLERLLDHENMLKYLNARN